MVGRKVSGRAPPARLRGRPNGTRSRGSLWVVSANADREFRQMLKRQRVILPDKQILIEPPDDSLYPNQDLPLDHLSGKSSVSADTGQGA